MNANVPPVPITAETFLGRCPVSALEGHRCRNASKAWKQAGLLRQQLLDAICGGELNDTELRREIEKLLEYSLCMHHVAMKGKVAKTMVEGLREVDRSPRRDLRTVSPTDRRRQYYEQEGTYQLSPDPTATHTRRRQHSPPAFARDNDFAPEFEQCSPRSDFGVEAEALSSQDNVSRMDHQDILNRGRTDKISESRSGGCRINPPAEKSDSPSATSSFIRGRTPPTSPPFPIPPYGRLHTRSDRTVRPSELRQQAAERKEQLELENQQLKADKTELELENTRHPQQKDAVLEARMQLMEDMLDQLIFERDDEGEARASQGGDGMLTGSGLRDVFRFSLWALVSLIALVLGQA